MNWDDLVEQAARDIYAAKLKGGVSPAMVEQTAGKLMRGVFSGYGKNFDSPGLGDKDYAQLKAIESNVFVFSGFKNYQQLRECTNLLVDSDGNKRSFDDWFKDVRAIDKTYNKVYARAEYNNALNTSNAISRWQTFQAEKETLPYLRWSLAPSENHCPVCTQYKNVTLPVDHAFWKTHFYPVHFGCLCTIEQTADSTKLTRKKDIPAPVYPKAWKMFERNAGIDGVVFPETHPYFETSEAERKRVMLATMAIIPKRTKPAAPARAGFKKEYQGKKGGNVYIHKQHAAAEIKENTTIAKKLADNGEQVVLPMHSKTKGVKNPDAIIKGKQVDFKNPATATSHNTIQGHIRSANVQGAEIVVIYLERDNITAQLIKRALGGSLKRKRWNVNIKQVWLLNKKGQLVKLTRRRIIKGEYDKKLAKVGLK